MRRSTLALLVGLLAIGLTSCARGGASDISTVDVMTSEAAPRDPVAGVRPEPGVVRPGDDTFDPDMFTARVRAALGEEHFQGDERSQWVVSSRSEDQEIRIRTTLMPGQDDVVSATFVCLMALEVAIPDERPQLRVEARDGSELAWSHWEEPDGWTCGAGAV